MSSLRNPVRSASARTAGFTLIELLIALVIAGILAGVMFQLFQGQSRFVAMQSAREEALQNGRGALDLIGTELRAVHPHGLLETENRSIDFVLPRAWGLVCKSTPSMLAAIFPNVAFAAYGLGSDPTSGGVLPSGMRVEVPVSAGSWEKLNANNWGPGQFADCADLKSIDTNARVLRFTGSSLQIISMGTLIYIGERVRYDVAAVPSLGGDAWIRRSAGWAGTTPDMQPLGGPVPTGADNLAIRYQVDGAMVASITDPAQRKKVTAVEMRVVTQSREKVGSDRLQRSTDTLFVYLRNRGL